MLYLFSNKCESSMLYANKLSTALPDKNKGHVEIHIRLQLPAHCIILCHDKSLVTKNANVFYYIL